MTKKPEANDAAFENQLARLEEIVRELEEGSQGLEESLARFEEGISLARSLEGKLDQAQKRVEVILASGAREPLDEPDQKATPREDQS